MNKPKTTIPIKRCPHCGNSAPVAGNKCIRCGKSMRDIRAPRPTLPENLRMPKE